jgi:hypothetical protein
MVVLPRLDGVVVQHPPHRATTDGLAEGLLGSVLQIRDRLATDRQLGFGDRFARHGAHEGAVQGGKKPAVARGRVDPRR